MTGNNVINILIQNIWCSAW